MVGVEGIRCAKRFCVQCNAEHWHHVHEITDSVDNWYTCWVCGDTYRGLDADRARAEHEKKIIAGVQHCEDRLCDGHCWRCWYV